MSDRPVRSGRRPGRHDTRAEILAAARECFADAGYDSTTIRGVAARGGIDPAMVHRHFGTKKQLFLAAAGLPEDLSEVASLALQGDGPGTGERVLRTFLELWDAAPLRGATFSGLLRLATSDPGGALALRKYLEQAVGELWRTPGVPLGSQRMGVIASQLLGIAVCRYVLKLEPLASAAPDRVAAEMGWIVQKLLTDASTATRQARAATATPGAMPC